MNAEPKHRLKPTDDGYGNICPNCAGPKHRQSKRCAQCYTDLRRAGAFPPPPVPRRTAKPKPRSGGSKGRPQPQTHPWRAQNALLFVKRRVEEMADQGQRPATAGGRLRAHIALQDEAA